MGNTLPYAFLERIQMILPDIHPPSLLSTSYTHFCEKVSFSEKGKRKGHSPMITLEHILPGETNSRFSWQLFLLDSLLAIVGAMMITGIIYLFELYPRIPNISIVYLLVVLALASTRGRYASILASLVAFLSFDFFLVPPLYVFTINRVEEWIALFVFLVTAILTSQLAVALRKRALEASRRERETHILYDLVRITNQEAEPERQFHTIAQAVVDVLSSWGCMIAPFSYLIQSVPCRSRPALINPRSRSLCHPMRKPSLPG